MDREYTESFTIPAGGWTGGTNGLMLTNGNVNAITADVRLWRDNQGTGGLSTISIRSGEILPLKVRYINYAVVAGNTMIGFN